MAIQIADGFQLRVAKPLDDRQNVETVAQLDPTYGYEGQIVYVKDVKQFYTCYKNESGSLAYKVMETGSSTPNESAGIELWVSGESYEENDFVSYNDYIYRCKIANNDTDFVEDNWEKQSDTHIEITEQEILDLLGLTDEELETMAQLIDDNVTTTDKTHSSSKIYADIQQCLQDSKDFTLEELGKKIGASYEVVTSTDDMVSQDYLYLLNNGNGYDIYIVNVDNIPVVIGDTAIDLSGYVTKTELESELGTETLGTTSQTVKGAINEVANKSEIITLTKDEYEALTTKDTETYYITSDDMTMYKGESQVLGGKSLVGKETALYDGNISATGTYTLTDDVNNYDFIIISYTALGGENIQSLTMSKIEISKCIDDSHRFMCVYGYAANDSYIAGYFNNDKLILNACIGLIVTSITGYKFGQITVQNTITNPAPEQSYSTEEQLTGGTWIDGKPIYRKVITGTGKPISGTVIAENIDDVVSQGGLLQTSENVKFPFPRVYKDYETQFRCFANVLKMYNSDSSITVGAYRIWVEYTKTTDA